MRLHSGLLPQLQMPSPLGKVAERSEVGRGSHFCNAKAHCRQAIIIIFLRKIRKCSAFSADTRGRVSLQHRMLQMMIDGAVEAPVGTPLPGCPVILEQNHIAAGDKMLFPFGKSRKCKHFRAGGSCPAPTGESCLKSSNYNLSSWLISVWSCDE
jgi:hypothetical protein